MTPEQRQQREDYFTAKLRHETGGDIYRLSAIAPDLCSATVIKNEEIAGELSVTVEHWAYGLESLTWTRSNRITLDHDLALEVIHRIEGYD